MRNTQVSGSAAVARGIPLETFTNNKEMGRILIRRGGETIAAGKIHKPTCPEDGSDHIGRRRSGNQWLEQAGMSKEGYIDITVMLTRSQTPSVHVSAWEYSQYGSGE